MKSTKHLFLSSLYLVAIFLIANNVTAQDSVPKEVSAIVSMKLDDGQAKLESLGYEVCYSSLFGGKQDWFNEEDRICVTVKFKKKSKEITEVVLNPATSECQQRLDASKEVWEKYHDGQAPVNTPKIDEERKKLADKGFKVSYWIDEIVPGRRSEYWVNDDAQKTIFILWEVQGVAWVKTDKTEYKLGKNPRPTN